MNIGIFDIFRGMFGFSQLPNRPRLFLDEDYPQHGDSNTWSDDDRNLPDGFDPFEGPLTEMHRIFTQQMEDMLNQFGMFQGSPIFGLPEVPNRDFEEPRLRSPREDVLKPGYINDPNQKVDVDLDDYVSKNGSSSLFRGNEFSLADEVPTRIVGQSIVRKITKLPDGRVQHEEVVRDNAGNEQRTITRTIGDQSHSVVTITGSNGVETTETLDNIDEGKLSDFNKKWNTEQSQQSVESPKRGTFKIFQDDFPFHFLFK